VDVTHGNLTLVLRYVGDLPLIFDREDANINLVLPYGATGFEVVRITELNRNYTYYVLPALVKRIKGGHDILLPKPWEKYLASVLLPGEELILEIPIPESIPRGKLLVEVPGDRVIVIRK